MTCGTPDQIILSILNFPLNETLRGVEPGCAQSLQSYWSNLDGWPFPITVYLPYFLATLITEALALTVFLKVSKWKRNPSRSATWWGTLLIVNLASHPFAFYVMPWVSYRFQLRWDYCLFFAEIGVLFLEAGIYAKRMELPFRKAILLSLIVNLVSWWLGAYLLAVF